MSLLCLGYIYIRWIPTPLPRPPLSFRYLKGTPETPIPPFSCFVPTFLYILPSELGLQVLGQMST